MNSLVKPVQRAGYPMRPEIGVGRSYYLKSGEVITIVRFSEQLGFVCNLGQAHTGYGGEEILRELTPQEYQIRRLERNWENDNQ